MDIDVSQDFVFSFTFFLSQIQGNSFVVQRLLY